MIDLPLWLACQRIVYGWRINTSNRPFAVDICTPRRKPASWLYHLLAANPSLRRQVIS